MQCVLHISLNNIFSDQFQSFTFNALLIILMFIAKTKIRFTRENTDFQFNVNQTLYSSMTVMPQSFKVIFQYNMLLYFNAPCVT